PGSTLSLLLVQRLSKRLLLQLNILFVARWVDEGVLFGALQAVILRLHPIISAVGPEKHVARERLEDPEHLAEIVGDPGIVFVVRQPVARVDVGTADNDDGIGLVSLGDAPRPRGTAAGVTGSSARGRRDATEFYLVAILQHAIDGAGGPAAVGVE